MQQQKFDGSGAMGKIFKMAMRRGQWFITLITQELEEHRELVRWQVLK